MPVQLLYERLQNSAPLLASGAQALRAGGPAFGLWHARPLSELQFPKLPPPGSPRRILGSMSYDEVEIEDMAWNEELQAYTYQCPCGDLFQITLVRTVGRVWW